MTTPTPSRALDRDEAAMIEQSRALDGLGHVERVDLLKRLRARRDRVQGMIRRRTRQARTEGSNAGPDAGAREKKAVLTEAIARVSGALGGRKASLATDHLRQAVAAKAKADPWRGPEDRTADTGPAETPNTRIAPSGALHAEGMRAVISRSTGDR